jgi:hypothetical protein
MVLTLPLETIKKTAMKTLNYDIANFITVKESEKAIGLKAWKSPIGNAKVAWEYIMWIPKSCIKNGIIADWFLCKKYSDLSIDGYDVILEVR